MTTLADLEDMPSMFAKLKLEVDEIRAELIKSQGQGMTVAQAAVALACSEKTVRRRIASGELQHRRIGPSGSRVVVYLDRQSALRISSGNGT